MAMVDMEWDSASYNVSPAALKRIVSIRVIFGITGLTLATSISAIITTSLLYISLRRKEIYKFSRHFLVQIAKMIISTTVMSGVIFGVRFLLPIDNIIISIIIEVITGVFIYMALAYILKINFATTLIKKILIMP